MTLPKGSSTMRALVLSLGLIAIAATASYGQTGACCQLSGHLPPICTVLTETECYETETWYEWLEGEDCDPNPCREPGACCLASGECQLVVDYQCVWLGVEFHGSGVSCNDTVCQTYPGACCFEDEHCEILDGLECAGQYGEWQGIETPCDPNPCLGPVGACCYGDACAGDCVMLIESACWELFTAWDWIEHGTCDPSPCFWCPSVEETTWGEIKSTYR